MKDWDNQIAGHPDLERGRGLSSSLAENLFWKLSILRFRCSVSVHIVVDLINTVLSDWHSPKFIDFDVSME